MLQSQKCGNERVKTSQAIVMSVRNENTDSFPDDDRPKYLQLGQRNDGASLRPVPDGLLLSRVVVVASGRV